MPEQWKPRPEYAIPAAEAIARLVVIPDYDDGQGSRPCVHTIRDRPGGMALGAHWGREELVALIEEIGGAEETEGLSRAIGHRLRIWDKTSWLYLEAYPPAEQ